MNQFQLVAQVVEREMLRYTPAGIPIVSGKLAHSSQQLEAKVHRLVEFEISALAVGEISGRFSQLELSQLYLFTGFMARKNRNSKSLIFHLTNIDENRVENKFEDKLDKLD
jgi:primosomal replication protein N